MLARSLTVVALVVLAGCARATLPYTPEQQPRGTRVSADYQLVADRVRIEVDTGGQRLEQAWIFKPDGTSVAPLQIDNAPLEGSASPSVGVGVGGGGAFGGRVGVGTGVSIGIPIGGGSSRIAGNTITWFPAEAAGPPPWRVYLKLAGIAPTTILVGRSRPQ